jgi:hypothetical protein
MRHRSACTRHENRETAARARGRVLRSVLRPVRVIPVARASGVRSGIAVVKACASGRKRHRGLRTERVRLAVHRRLERDVRDASEPEEGQRPSSQREQRAPVTCPHVVVQLQKSVSDLRVSNTLVARVLEKDGQRRVNRGLARSGRRRESASASSKRKIGRRAHRRNNGRAPAWTQDDVRASSSGSFVSARRCGGRGTGAVIATGFHEGFLTDGRHPGSS